MKNGFIQSNLGEIYKNNSHCAMVNLIFQYRFSTGRIQVERNRSQNRQDDDNFISPFPEKP